MSNTILLMGQSGTGKSSSVRSLNADETFIINVLNKPLPFKGWKARYNKDKKNYFSSDNAQEIMQVINAISSNPKYSHIKTIIIDDFQYVMANEYMRRANETGYSKFTQIGQNAWKIIEYCISSREDIDIFVLSHTEVDKEGNVKCKTIGNMLDEKITLEGMFTVVLHSMLRDDKYVLLTQFDGTHIAKSPLEMFDDRYIDNDLSYVKQKIKEYGENE